MLSPMLCGIDTLIAVARDGRVAILSHPALCGVFFADDHGIAPHVLLGDLMRRCGADGVIYPDAGGRFPLSRSACDLLRDRLREPQPEILPSMPVPGGGLRVDRISEQLDANGPDMIYLVGGSLHAGDDVTKATRKLMDNLRAPDFPSLDTVAPRN